MNKLIEINELEVGDEIIISGNSNLKYMKVLIKPEISATKTHWRTKLPMYKSVRASLRQDEVLEKNWNGVEYSVKRYIFEQDISKHNKKISIDLSDRDIFLVKRKQIYYEPY